MLLGDALRFLINSVKKLIEFWTYGRKICGAVK